MEREEILEYIEKIKKNNTLVIVEGKKDKAALEELGLKNIVTLSKEPIYKVIEDVSLITKDVVILTDLDVEGKKLFGKLNSGLQYHGVRIDNRFREFLFKKTKLRQIEGIISYLNNQ